MPRFSQVFKLKKSQAELDFVDVPVNADIPLFVDPFALSQKCLRPGGLTTAEEYSLSDRETFGLPCALDSLASKGMEAADH